MGPSLGCASGRRAPPSVGALNAVVAALLPATTTGGVRPPRRYPAEVVAEPPVVPILLYHSVSEDPPVGQERFTVTPARFVEHMDVVAAAGGTVPLSTHVAALVDRDRSVAVGRPIVTFDDGYADFGRAALPVLVERGLTATLFQTTGVIGAEFCGTSMMDAPALREAAAAGTEIGSHSVTHPHLDLIPADRLERELVDSRRSLEELLQRPVEGIAYPHGSHHRRVVAAARRAGYRWGAAVKDAGSHPADDPWAVARVTITAAHTAADIEAILTGAVERAWRGERWRTTAYRQVRRIRHRGAYEVHR